MPELGDLGTIEYVIGIDEAGRGPIAGPVAVGAVLMPVSAYRGQAFRDSKHLPMHKREAAYDDLAKLQTEGAMRFAVSMAAHSTIDAQGIVPSIERALRRSLKAVNADPATCIILLDGALRAPEEFRQQTIIRGDETVYPIALASIAAKVERDARMRRLASRYPAYGFDAHKGYGTQEHYARIRKHGLCAIHRRSFCKGLTAQKAVVE